jgi:HlyD family secretion protein
MDLRKELIRRGTVLTVLFIIGGLLLALKGNDAVTLAAERKEGILTAEQVQIAFENVGGRLVREDVTESQEVKKGDILMVLDSVDVDLAIQKIKAQIRQLDAQINQSKGTIKIGYAKASTTELQSYRLIEQQKRALDSAQAVYDNQKRNYERYKVLAESGAVSRMDFDNVKKELDVAEANVGQQRRLLDKQLAGTTDRAKKQVLAKGDAGRIRLPEIEQQRQDLKNSEHGVQNLVWQRENLAVQLKELQVKRERLTMKAPEDGKILKLISKSGEMVDQNVPVILLESRRVYYDIYLPEYQAARLKPGDEIGGRVLAGQKKVRGIIRFITAAPGFADLKMSREKGQADLSAFQVRIYVDPGEGILPGMTVEVDRDEFDKG